jgi:hypothetical protein
MRNLNHMNNHVIAYFIHLELVTLAEAEMWLYDCPDSYEALTEKAAGYEGDMNQECDDARTASCGTMAQVFADNPISMFDGCNTLDWFGGEDDYPAMPISMGGEMLPEEWEGGSPA